MRRQSSVCAYGISHVQDITAVQNSYYAANACQSLIPTLHLSMRVPHLKYRIRWILIIRSVPLTATGAKSTRGRWQEPTFALSRRCNFGSTSLTSLPLSAFWPQFASIANSGSTVQCPLLSHAGTAVPITRCAIPAGRPATMEWLCAGLQS